MEDSRQEHWRDVPHYGEEKSKINALRWDVYTKYNEELIKKYFSVFVPHPKGGGIIWTCVKDNNIEENQDYEAIGLRGFGYTLFEVEESGGITEGFYGYPYFKHIIHLQSGDLLKQIVKN